QETEDESQIVDRSPRSGKDAVLLDSIPQATSDSLAVKDSLATRIDSTELKVPTDTLILDSQEVEKPKLSRRERRELRKQEKLKEKQAKAEIEKAKEEKEAADKTPEAPLDSIPGNPADSLTIPDSLTTNAMLDS